MIENNKRIIKVFLVRNASDNLENVLEKFWHICKVINILYKIILKYTRLIKIIPDSTKLY